MVLAFICRQMAILETKLNQMAENETAADTLVAMDVKRETVALDGELGLLLIPHALDVEVSCEEVSVDWKRGWVGGFGHGNWLF